MSVSVQVLGLATGPWALWCAKGQQFTAPCLGLWPPELHCSSTAAPVPQALRGFSPSPLLSLQCWLLLRLNWSLVLWILLPSLRSPHLSPRSPWNEHTRIRIFGKPLLLQVYLKIPGFKQQNTKLEATARHHTCYTTTFLILPREQETAKILCIREVVLHRPLHISSSLLSTGSYRYLI